MIFRSPEPLSPRARGLLAEERRFEPEAPELRQRILARARASLRETESAARLGLWGRARAAVVAAAVLTSGAAAFAMWDGWRSDAGAGDVVVAAGGIASSLPVWNVNSVLAEEGVSEPAAMHEPEERPGPSARPSAAEAHELSLLRRARLALTRGEYASALDAITEHRRQFPSTPLREEREALRIRALDGLGRTDEAGRAAEQFHHRYPRSVLAPRDEAGGRSGR